MYNTDLEKTLERLRSNKETASGECEDEDDGAEWVKAKLGFSPDTMQQEVLRGGQHRGLLNCTRQWGKSTVTAAKAIYEAYHVAESLTLVVSASSRQSGEFLR